MLEEQNHPVEPAHLIQAAVLQLSYLKKLSCKTKQCALINALVFFAPE